MLHEGLCRIAHALRWLTFGNQGQRRRVRQELARLSAGLFGDFPLSEDQKSWRQDHSFFQDYKRLSPHNPYSQDRKWVLREFVRFSNKLSGDIAECGCYEGASAFFMAQESKTGQLHLFDSFEGLSSPQPSDQPQRPDVMPWSAGDLTASEEKLRKNLADFKNIAIYRGWIPQRFVDVEHCRFRLVHVDVDLYQPTRDSLDFFYPRLVPGGIIIMDDYGFLTCPGAKQAADEFSQLVRTPIVHLPTGQGIIIR